MAHKIAATADVLGASRFESSCTAPRSPHASGREAAERGTAYRVDDDEGGRLDQIGRQPGEQWTEMLDGGAQYARIHPRRMFTFWMPDA